MGGGQLCNTRNDKVFPKLISSDSRRVVCLPFLPPVPAALAPVDFVNSGLRHACGGFMLMCVHVSAILLKTSDLGA